MYELLSRRVLAPGLVLLRISAPQVARKMKPGQFVIVRADEEGERVPLSVADWDEESITVIVQDVGVSTRKLGLLAEGDNISNLAGPLGQPSEIGKYGTVAIVSGCFGIGPAYALARALGQAENRVICILEARNSDWLFWQDRLREVADRVIVTCFGEDDACATGPLKELLESERIDRVYALGCTFMMMEVSETTKPYRVPTRVSLMPLMVDGTGMCGACRCSVNGERKLGCVDGPEFDGHQVDWSLLVQRMRSYLGDETEALELWDRKNWHRAVERKAGLAAGSS